MSVRKGTLIRIKSAHNNMRTDVIEGEFRALPVQGGRFSIVAEPLDPKQEYRQLLTSWIEKVVEARPGHVLFRTENTIYLLSFEETE